MSFLLLEPGFCDVELYLDYTMCDGMKDPPTNFFQKDILSEAKTIVCHEKPDLDFQTTVKVYIYSIYAIFIFYLLESFSLYDMPFLFAKNVLKETRNFTKSFRLYIDKKRSIYKHACCKIKLVLHILTTLLASLFFMEKE